MSIRGSVDRLQDGSPRRFGGPAQPFQWRNAMRFMMIVKADADYEAGRPFDPALLDAVGRFAEQKANAGVLLQQGGLLPSSAGARVRVAGGKMSVTDGPFAETKELVGGFA